jgi:DNA-binding CsgD family transcriptional regulator
MASACDRVMKGALMAKERFLTLGVVQRELALTAQQVLDLVISGDLPAIRPCGCWRVERRALEQYICLAYEDAARLSQEMSDGASPRPDGRLLVDPPGEDSSGGKAPSHGLTPQMMRVLQLVAQGLSNAEIARELSVEVSTVKSHMSRLLTRVGARDRANLIALAWRLGIVPSND